MNDPEDETSLKGKKVEIPDERVKWDFEQLDCYQSYSSELIRLALGAMAAVGFLVTFLLKDGSPYFGYLLDAGCFWWFLKGGICCLSVSCGLALAHKYLASDGMSDHLSAIKRLIWMEENPDAEEDWSAWQARILTEEKDRDDKYIKSGKMLKRSAVSFGLGVFFIAVSFFQISPVKAHPKPEKTPAETKEAKPAGIVD